VNTRTYCLISSVVFAAIGIAHLVRAARSLPVLVGTFSAPVGISWAAGVAGVLLAVWGLRSSRAVG
jgi:hypothetical protein